MEQPAPAASASTSASTSAPITAPAFGEADLSNCEREQIHLAGSIQPHGVLLVVSEPDLVIRQVSANAGWLPGSPPRQAAPDPDHNADPRRAEALLGRPLAALSAQLEQRVRMHLGSRLDRIPVAFRCVIGDHGQAFDGLLHRPAAGGLIVELEPAGPALALTGTIERALQRLLATTTLAALCDETARVLKAITGYDRVMVYRFDEDGHGEVFAEQREAHLEAFLGNHYPDSDIPQIARRLYERNRVRLLNDVNYLPVPLLPQRSPLTGEELDMSLCALRSMSPIHLQYLKNMGVAATLVVSLLAGGRLWGLIACHHYQPRFVAYQTRALCELLAEAVATRIAALEGFSQAQAEMAVRRLEQRMIEAISRDGDWRTALFDQPKSLLSPVDASGAALLMDGEVQGAGEVPATADLRAIGDWLDRQPRAPVLACKSLGNTEAQFAPLKAVASGVLAVPLSPQPGEYLLWLRPERLRTRTWGGNPFKPVEVGSDPALLSPRRSFTKWHQVVEGTAVPWSPADLTTARLIGESIADVIQQFRSVRLLLAKHQLDRISAQVVDAEQPIVIADASGRILMTNRALQRLLLACEDARVATDPDPTAGTASPSPAAPSSESPSEPSPPTGLAVLARQLAPDSELSARIADLCERHLPWRGEVVLGAATDAPATFLVRADPVCAVSGQLLGHVLLLTDLRHRVHADAARRRFQNGALEPHPSLAVRLQSGEDRLYRTLFNDISGNAQLAALEITDGVDLTRIPALLDGVQASVSRAAELLEHLIWYERAEGRGSE